MDDLSETKPSLVNALDDWQRGFLDSIFYCQQIIDPTPAQYSAAIKRLHGFIRFKYGGSLPPDGRMSLGSVIPDALRTDSHASTSQFT